MFSRRVKYSLIILLLVMCFSTSAFASIPLVDNDGHSPFVKIVDDLIGTVVNIKVEWEVSNNYKQYSSPFPFNDDFFKFFFPQPDNKRRSIGYGSGFIFRKEGKEVYILTNNHVVGKSDDAKITVTLHDQMEYNAEVVGLDDKTDVAVIKIEVEKGADIAIAPLGDSDWIKVGDWVIAIGNPFSENLQGTVTTGVVSAKGRANLNFGEDSPMYQDYIQTDAAINPGNSGGPLVDINGNVIGINAAISSVSGGNIGIGFAIPINIVKALIDDLIDKGFVERAYLGILPQEVTPALQKSLDLPNLEGVLIGKVEDDTPAEKAGLKKRDVIIEFDGEPVKNINKFRLMVANKQVGDKISMTILRDGKKITKTAQLEAYPDTVVAAKSPSKEDGKAWLGIEVKSLDSDFAKQLNLKIDKGVIISKIDVDSPAYDSNLNVGDVILELGDEEIESTKDYNKAVEKLKDSDTESVLLYVLTPPQFYHYVAIKVQ
ncbi:MAG: trypsin-like peptidase domain-containing protein [Candidatus Cloacimonetes bacterium]|nr:trypsin-like peptidase domain-containing protein [Candidatus Cloacimonadota bacterium]